MGAVFCLLSAIGFGAMAIFGKLAYDEGVTVGDLLLVRFGVAAVVMLGIVWWRGGFGALPRRTAVAAFAMGAVGYAAQSASYFAALDRIDASLLTLLLYFYPVLVMVGAVALKRESWSRRRLAALGLAFAGILLVLLGAATSAFDWLGAALGVTSALVYTAYILTGDRVLSGIAPLSLTALVCCGAATTYAVATVLRGGPTSLDAGPAAWFWLVTLALREHGRRDHPLLRRPRPRGPLGRLDPVDPRAGRHRRPGGRGLQRVAVSRSSCWAGCWCSPPCWSSSGRRPGRRRTASARHAVSSISGMTEPIGRSSLE